MCGAQRKKSYSSPYTQPRVRLASCRQQVGNHCWQSPCEGSVQYQEQILLHSAQGASQNQQLHNRNQAEV